MGKCNSNNQYIYYYGQESFRWGASRRKEHQLWSRDQLHQVRGCLILLTSLRRKSSPHSWKNTCGKVSWMAYRVDYGGPRVHQPGLCLRKGLHHRSGPQVWGCCEQCLWLTAPLGYASVAAGFVWIYIPHIPKPCPLWGNPCPETRQIHIEWLYFILGIYRLGCLVPQWLSACNAGYMGSIPGSRRSPEEGNGNPLLYSCLGNPMDRSLVGYSPWSFKESDTTEHRHIHHYRFFHSRLFLRARMPSVFLSSLSNHNAWLTLRNIRWKHKLN